MGRIYSLIYLVPGLFRSEVISFSALQFAPWDLSKDLTSAAPFQSCQTQLLCPTPVLWIKMRSEADEFIVEEFDNNYVAERICKGSKSQIMWQ